VAQAFAAGAIGLEVFTGSAGRAALGAAVGPVDFPGVFCGRTGVQGRCAHF
jgi:hypothetical protein